MGSKIPMFYVLDEERGTAQVSSLSEEMSIVGLPTVDNDGMLVLASTPHGWLLCVEVVRFSKFNLSLVNPISSERKNLPSTHFVPNSILLMKSLGGEEKGCDIFILASKGRCVFGKVGDEEFIETTPKLNNESYVVCAELHGKKIYGLVSDTTIEKGEKVSTYTLVLIDRETAKVTPLFELGCRFRAKPTFKFKVYLVSLDIDLLFVRKSYGRKHVPQVKLYRLSLERMDCTKLEFGVGNKYRLFLGLNQGSIVPLGVEDKKHFVRGNSVYCVEEKDISCYRLDFMVSLAPVLGNLYAGKTGKVICDCGLCKFPAAEGCSHDAQPYWILMQSALR